jgi:hypothetical protein
MKAHPLFHSWRPDEVAECLEGVSMDLGAKLWGFVPEYDEELAAYELPPEPDAFCLARWWDKLSQEDQAALNAAAVAMDRELGLDEWDEGEND